MSTLVGQLYLPQLQSVLWIVASMIVLSGCSDGGPVVYPVSGKVVYQDGKPVAGVWVSFRPTSGEPKVTARGQTQGDGSFVLTTFKSGDGAPPGVNQAIVSVPLPGDRSDYQAAPRAVIARRYSSYMTSGLEFTVTEDREKNHFEIAVAK